MHPCFDGIISWKGGCESPTGLLLDNVVRASEVEQFITADYSNINELIEEKLDFAIRNVVNECIAKYQYAIIPRTVIENQRIGFFAENQTLKAAIPNKYAGVELECANTLSYFELYVSEISLYVNYTGDVRVYVIDTMTGEELDTITVAAVAGVPSTTYVGKGYPSNKRKRRIAFVYDADSIQSYLTNTIGDGCFSCTGGRYAVGQYINGRSIQYPSSGAGILANITTLNHTAGVSVNYNLRCDNESWLCAHRNALALPILYRTAEELLFFAVEMAKSERLNSKVSIDRESLERRHMKAHEDYASQMGLVLKNIVPPNDGVCFVCRQTSKYVTTLP